MKNEETQKILYFHDCRLAVIDKFRKTPCGFNSPYNKLFIFLGDKAEIQISGVSALLEKGDCITVPAKSSFAFPQDLSSSFIGISFTLEKTDLGNSKLYDYLINSLNEVCITKRQNYADIFQNDFEFENSMELMKFIIIAAKNKNYNQAGKISQLVLNYITLNYPMHISSELLENTFNMSYSKLLAAFKKDFGISIHRKLKEIRINVAKKLLTETNIPISEIAFRVGYENEYYFSASFKNTTSQSPSKFRKSEAERSGSVNES